MKKTLLISEIFPPLHGGSGRWFWELYSRLPRDNYVIAAGNTSESAEFDKDHDLSVFRINLSSRSWGIRSITGLQFYWKTFRAIRQIVKNEGVDSIHCGRCLPEGVFGFLFNKLYRIPYLCYIHGEDVESASTSRELTFLVRRILSNASRLIANSNNTRQILIEKWLTDHDKTIVLHPGFDAQRFRPAGYDGTVRSSLGWGRRPVILTVGRLQQRKGQDMLIQALPSIRKHFPDVLYAIIGGGDEREKLETLVESLDLEQHVMFMSEISDEKMIQCYQQCTIFALPNRTIGSDIEGFGMVLVEAQGCGKPVVAGQSGGTAETMLVGQSGYIVDCTMPTVIADVFTDLLNRPPQELDRIGVNGRQHVEQNFDWAAHVSRARAIFTRLD